MCVQTITSNDKYEARFVLCVHKKVRDLCFIYVEKKYQNYSIYLLINFYSYD